MGLERHLELSDMALCLCQLMEAWKVGGGLYWFMLGRKWNCACVSESVHNITWQWVYGCAHTFLNSFSFCFPIPLSVVVWYPLLDSFSSILKKTRKHETSCVELCFKWKNMILQQSNFLRRDRNGMRSSRVDEIYLWAWDPALGMRSTFGNEIYSRVVKERLTADANVATVPGSNQHPPTQWNIRGAI